MLYITGITGHSGRWLLRRLEAENYPGRIRLVMREKPDSAPEKYDLFRDCRLNIEFVVGDLKDEEFLINSLKDVDTIIHISGIAFSELLFNVAIKSQVKWAIMVHTTGRYSKYKSASECYIRIEDEILSQRDSIAVTVLRPTMIYGSSMDRNMYRLVGFLKRHRFFPLFGDGSNLMQPVHARDLGNAYYDVLIRPEITRNKEYNLSGKEPITYLQIIKTICRYLNKKVVIVRVPITFSLYAAKVYNKLFKNAVIKVEQVMRMQEDKAFSHEDAFKDFGYDPVSFEDGIKEEVGEYLSGVRVDFSNVRY